MTACMIKKRVRRLIAFLFAVLQLFSISAPAFAEEVYEEKWVEIRSGNSASSVRVLLDRGELYVCAEDAAKLKNCSWRTLEQPACVVFYINDYSLYLIEMEKCAQHNGLIFVPFAEGLASLGMALTPADNYLALKEYRTPAEFLRMLDGIVNRQDFYLYNLIQGTELTFTAGQILAKTYALLSPFAFKTWWDVATGTDDQMRYDQAFVKIISNEDSTADFLVQTGELDEKLLLAERIITYVEDTLEEDGHAANFLRSAGINEETVRALFRASDPAPYNTDLGGWLHAYEGVSEAVDFDYLLKAVQFYAMSADMDESVLLALQLAFANCNNRYICSSVDRMMDIKTGNGAVSRENLYSGYAGRTLFSAFLTSFEKAYVDASLDKKYISFEKDLFNLALNTDDQMEAVRFLPIFSNIQFDLLSYFYGHRYDGKQYTAKELRAVAIMYLKSALAAYEMFSFDKDLGSTVNLFKSSYSSAMVEILTYEEQEYCPTFDNQAVTEWLVSNYHSLADYSEELAIYGFAYSLYNGLWHSGRYYGEHDVYEQTLKIRPIDSGAFYFEWEKYRIAGLSASAKYNEETGYASFTSRDFGYSISGWLHLENDSVTLHIETSDNAQIKNGEEYVFSEKRGIDFVEDGRYYAKIYAVRQDGSAYVLLYSQSTLDDSIIPSLREGSIVTVDGVDYYCSGYKAPGEYDGFTRLKPIYTFKYSPTAEFNSFYVSQGGLNGEWALFAVSENPMIKEIGTGNLVIEADATISDELFNMRYGYYPDDSSIFDMIQRDSERFFSSQYFIITIMNHRITDIKTVHMA